MATQLINHQRLLTRLTLTQYNDLRDMESYTSEMKKSERFQNTTTTVSTYLEKPEASL